MAGFTTPSGERFAIFGEGGGQALADELDVPLLGKVPLTMPLREQADAGTPLVFTDPDDPAAQAIRQTARGIVALSPIELPVLQAPGARADGLQPADGRLTLRTQPELAGRAGGALLDAVMRSSVALAGRSRQLEDGARHALARIDQPERSPAHDGVRAADAPR